MYGRSIPDYQTMIKNLGLLIVSAAFASEPYCSSYIRRPLAGIDPSKSTIYLQSAVHEVTELALYFGNLVTVPRLSRVPSIKEMAHRPSIATGLFPQRLAAQSHKKLEARAPSIVTVPKITAVPYGIARRSVMNKGKD